MERNQNQGTEQMGSQLGNQNGNVYNVPTSTWNKLDQSDQQQFNRTFKRLEGRTQEIINSLSPECRTPELTSHFAEIAANVAAAFIAEMHPVD